MNPYPVTTIQILAIVVSFLLLLGLFLLIRKKKLREEYSLLWIAIFSVFLFFSLFRGSIDYLSRWLGIHYQPAALFLILIACLFLLSFHFSIIISELKTKINKLVTTVALLEEKLEHAAGNTPSGEKKKSEES
ncbi:MAG: DUF2304 domain-containing protein [Candidatus Aminicenantes bacterium]|nr:DUF2304 domain-containing protein [Candidatus Aminicenantes bacterium]